MRYFRIELEGEIVVGIDQQVIDVVDDEWRETLYQLYTPEQIAEMVGYNMGVNRWFLSQLDGWADQSDENAKLLNMEIWTENVEEIEETDLI